MSSLFHKKRTFFFSLLLLLLLLLLFSTTIVAHRRRSPHDHGGKRPLRFGENGVFRILQVADMHYADGKSTECLDVLPSQTKSCSDLNTTAFLHRMIIAEKPDLLVFTGDNIFGPDATDAVKSLNKAFELAVESGIPWAAVLGNHDQESTLSRKGLMEHIVGMPQTVSQLNPGGLGYEIDGFGNYNLEIRGVNGSPFADESVLNLYFIDSGSYSDLAVSLYDWIKPSQQLWFQETSKRLQKQFMSKPEAHNEPAPGIAYFHIPLPEFSSFGALNMTGVRQEGISSPSVNSGFFTTMVEAGDVKAVFVGHDHLNDFCGELSNIHLCYAGGFGYHAYGKAGWYRRARVVDVSLERKVDGSWGGVESIKTRKRLDDHKLSTIEPLVLWSK